MSPLALASGTRATRATTPGATPKARDDQSRATDTAVKDVATAIEYLTVGELKSEDDDLTFEYLSIIAMQLSQQSKLSAKKASEAFKALSYLILELHRNGTIEAVTDAIAKAISLATKRVREEMEEATEMMASAAATSNNTAEELREECRNVVMEIRGAVEDISATVENAGANQRQGTQDMGEEARKDGTGSYADSVRRKVPPSDERG
jgi:ElaB/YqjD/DUF883 family membrane-anchored ribosome-binding protein